MWTAVLMLRARVECSELDSTWMECYEKHVFVQHWPVFVPVWISGGQTMATNLPLALLGQHPLLRLCVLYFEMGDPVMDCTNVT